MKHAFLLATVSLIAALPAYAEVADDQPQPSDIVVTANKYDQSQIDVAGSLTVLDKELIDAARLRNLRQLDDYAPNVSINQLGQVGGTYISIRGIESNPFIVNRAAVYIDNIPFRDLDAQTLADAEQVEILRGPQGTLYGANANAGVIVIRTASPGDTLEGHASAAVEAFGNGEVYPLRARIAGPISETLSASLSLNYQRGDSYVKNIASSIGKGGAIRDFTGVARLRFRPSTDTLVDLIGYHVNLTAPGLYEQEFAPLDRAIYDRNYSAAFNGERTTGRFEIVNEAPKRTKEREWGIGAALTQSVGAAELVVTGSYRRELESSFGTDLDLTAAPFAAGGDSDRNRFLNLEGRISGGEKGQFRWVAGVNYYEERKRQILSTLAGPGGFADFAPAPPQFSSAEDIAFFGQVAVPLTDRLNVTVGARYDRAKRRRVQEAGTLDLGPLGQFVFAAADGGDTFDEFIPKISVDFRATDALTLYATAAKGWLPGGFNLEASRFGVSAEFGPYGEEKLWSYEIGAKANLAENKLYVAASAFVIDGTSYQEFNVLTSPTGQALSTNLITSNAAIANKGFEVELVGRPAASLTLSAGFGYTDATYSRYVFSPAQDFTGNRVKLVPQFDLNASATWKSADGIFARAEIDMNGKTALNAENTVVRGTTTILGLSAGYETDSFGVRLFGRNLTGKRYAAGQAYANFLFGNDGTFYAPLAEPRVIGIEAEVRF